MKTTFFQNPKEDIFDEIQRMVDREHINIHETAYSDGKCNALKDPSLPLLTGDKLIYYIKSYKARYEELILKILGKYHPATHLPEGRIDAVWSELHNDRLSNEIQQLKLQINLLKNELKSFDPEEMSARIRKANLIGIGLFIGELVLNTQAFQVTGDNKIYSLALAASVSLTVCLGAHFAGRKYKDAKTKMDRRIVLIISVVGITVFSSIIASLRGMFLNKLGVEINPNYFTVFNIAFFGIAALANWYIYPTKEEIEENRERLHKYYQIQKLEKEKKVLEREQIEHEKITKEEFKTHLREPVKIQYCIERIKRLYKESVEAFIHGNRQCRMNIPDCYSDPIPELDIQEITFKTTNNKLNN